MKKIISRSILCATLLMGSIFATSCDSETIAAIIAQLLNTGTTYTFSGTGNAASLIGTGTNTDGSYNYASDGTGTVQTNIQVSVASSGSTATMVIPSFKCGSFTMSQVTFSNLVLSTNGNYNTLSVGESSSADGSITYNSQTYDVCNLYIECKLNDSEIIISSMSIYFGDEKYVINLPFSGKVVTQ